ncbi:MAG: hypothetical protein DRP90_00075 [Planctomycetota bacterium]|nr:MAG: hypothetical protein DRP90_00075 [Planctomycetota bacterium]
MKREALWRAVLAVLRSELDENERALLRTAEFAGVRGGTARLNLAGGEQEADYDALAERVGRAFSLVLGRTVKVSIRLDGSISGGRFFTPSFDEQFTFENFVVGPSNRLAHAAILSCAEAGEVRFTPVLIFGGEGLGKTHLLHALGHRLAGRKRVCSMTADEFAKLVSETPGGRSPEELVNELGSAEALLFDDLDRLEDMERSPELFLSLFDRLLSRNRLVVLASRRPAEALTGFENRLLSRLSWGISFPIERPDYETRLAMVREFLRRLEAELPDEVAGYVASRCTNGRTLEETARRLVLLEKLVSRPLDLDLVREILGASGEEEEETAIEDIQAAVAEEFGVTLAELTGRSRRKTVVVPRQAAMYLAREMTSYTLAEIGGLFGGRDHATVVHAHRKTARAMVSDKLLRKKIESVKRRIRERKTGKKRSAK